MFAAAKFEKTVHLFRLGVAESITTIQTIMDAGGHRLAVVPEVDCLVAGAYHRHGLAGYSISSGELIWSRKDLKRVQSIENDRNGNVLCFLEGKGGVRISPENGVTVESHRGVKKMFLSRFKDGIRFEVARDYRVIAQGVTSKIEPLSFAVLAAAFSGDCLAISESGGPVRVFELDGVTEIGRIQPPRGSHFLSLNYCDDLKLFGGVLWDFNSGKEMSLVHFDRLGSEVRRISFKDGYHVAYIPSRGSIVSCSGIEYSWDDGAEVFRYDFPRRK